MKKVRVECRGLGFAYGEQAVLRGIDLDVEPGEFFALLGPSGSGKSTLLRVIAGFNRHQRGELRVDGTDITGRAPWERNIGMVFQSYALWPHLSVWDNVAFGLVERRLDKATIRAKVGAALEMVGLQQYGVRRPNQLSGGQQQRVALARTLVVEPQVLLLDEPLSNLDRALRVQMRMELLALQRRLGITTLFVTHDQEEAMTTADRMAVLDRGALQQVGPPTLLYDRPANPFVADFVGTMNLLRARISSRRDGAVTVEIERGASFDVAAGPGMAGSETLVSFRPHVVRIAPADGARDASLVWLAATVETREFLGEFTRYRVRVGSQTLAVDQLHMPGAPVHASGARLHIGIEPAQVRLLPA